MIVVKILSKLTLLFSLYFGITALFAFKKDKKLKEINKFNKLGVLIAARNEEEVIGSLINSLNNSNYPKDKFDIIVIPNNCTDKTEEISKSLGAKIVKVPYPVRTKGEVLKYTFKHLKNSDYDAYIIIDADNLVHKDFLLKMNDGLNNGFKVAQCFRDAKNPSENWLTSSYTLFYYLQNFFFNKARMHLNGSATINGTGFMVAKEIVDKHGFNTKTLTEDSEFSGICTLNNIRIGFIKDAIVYDEHPTSFKTSWIQRKRWSSGSISCFYLYTKSLLSNFFRTKNISSLDMVLFYAAPIYQIITFAIPLTSFLIKLSDHLIDYYYLSSFLICYLGSIILNIFVVIVNHKKIKDYYKGIIFFPVFMISWFFINLVCLIKPVRNWEPIKHNATKNSKFITN